MPTTNQYLTYSEVALASYASVTAGVLNADAYVAAGMTRAEAEEFDAKWAVLDHDDLPDGFSATLFQRVDAAGLPTGEKVLGIRGSDSFVDVLVDYVNVAQLGSTWGMSQYQSLEEFYQHLLATGKLTDGEQFTVTGHSLGGFLAQGFTAKHDSVVIAAYTYDAPGFTGSIPAGGLGTQLLEKLFGITDASIPNDKIFNARAAEGISATAGLGQMIGFVNALHIEEDPNSLQNHSIVRLTDSLAVQNALVKLDSGATRIFDNLFATAANKSGATLEWLVNSMSSLTGRGSHVAIGDRNALYVALQELNGSEGVTRLAGHVTMAVVPQDIGNRAKTDFAAFLSLHAFSPFLLTADPTGDSVLKELNSSLAQQWLEDQSLTAADKEAGRQNFSDKYLSDRQTLLVAATSPQLAAIGYDGALRGKAIANYTFSDVAAGVTVKFSGTAANAGVQEAQRVIFGDGKNNTLSGSDAIAFGVGDRLYGGDGNDTINGMSGDDYLEGNSGADSLLGGDGADTLLGGSGDDILAGGIGMDVLMGGSGADTYQFSTGWGSDQIVDSDGLGSIQVSGVGPITGAGAKRVSDNVWQTPDAAVNYTLVNVSDGRNDLFITFADRPDVIRVVNWTPDKSVGITLPDASAPPPASTILTGDFAKEVSGTSYLLDSHGYQGTQPQAGAADVILGDARDELLQGLDGNDGLYGGDGADTLEGGSGADLLLGGRGRDVIRGGTGNDVIFGSAVGGIDTPNQTNFSLPQSSQTVIAQGFSWIASRANVPRIDPQTGVFNFRQVDVSGAVVSPGWLEGGQTLVEADGNVIEGGAGDDYIAAGTGNDTVSGGDDNDDIAGMDGNDFITGDAGDDFILGDGTQLINPTLFTPLDRQGGDTLIGGAGNDILVGQGGNDELYGGTEDDHLWGDGDARDEVPAAYHGDDYLDGGSGNDDAAGGGRNDTLFGGEGDDKLWGDGDRYEEVGLDAQGKDYLDGEDGADQLIGGGNDDTLYGGSGNDVMLGDDVQSKLPVAVNGSDYMDGEDGNDLMAGGGGSDTMFGGAGNDQLQGDDLSSNVAAAAHGDDYLDGEGGADTLIGGGRNDTLIGGEGNDYIRGDDLTQNVAVEAHGSDYLEGGSGDDILLGDAGNDTLVGGTGVDYLDGGLGDDVYRFAVGDSAPDAQGHTDSIVDAFGKNKVIIDGAVVDDIVLQPGTGVDLILAFSGSDALIVAGGLGVNGASYEIGDQAYTASALIGRRSDAPVQVTLENGGQGNYGGFNADSLSASARNSVLSGGRGDDVLSGSGGNNIYLYEAGDGADIVRDTSAKLDAQGQQVKNQISFGAGIDSTALKLSLTAGQLKIQVGDDATNSILIDGFDPAHALASTPIDEFAFADGTLLSYAQLVALGMDGTAGSDALSGTVLADALRGHEGNDTLTGLAGDDTLDGGAGDDSLSGGSGADTYVWGASSGADVIDDADNTVGTVDTLRITGISAADLIVTKADPDLFVRWSGGTDTVTIKNFSSGAAGVERFVFDDGTQWDTATIVANIRNELTDGPDSFTGTANNDIIDGKGGNDTLRGQAGADLLIGGVGNDSLDGAAGSDTLIGGSGSDTLAGGADADVYVFGRGDGSDFISETSADGSIDVLRLGSGISVSDVRLNASFAPTLSIIGTADQINLGSQSQVERIEFADGTVWNHEQILQRAVLDATTEGNDSITPFSSSPYSFTADGKGGNDSISLIGPGSHTVFGGSGDDALSTGAGNDTLDGGSGSDTLQSGAGNDVLKDGEIMRGGTGADTYILSAWTPVTIEDVSEDASVVDCLVLPAGVRPADVRVERIFNNGTNGYDDLRLATGSIGSPGILLSRFFQTIDPRDFKIEQVRFADGTVWTTGDLFARVDTGRVTTGADSILGFREADVIDASGGNDTVQGYFGSDQLLGGSGDDLLYGDTFLTAPDARDGNDILDGGTGRDTLIGGGGNDTYLWGRGVGNDRISEVAGTDTVLLASGIAPADVTLWRVGQDLIVALDANSTQLVVAGHFTSTNTQIENVRFADGTIWDGATIAARTTAGTQDSMVGTSANDTFVVDNVGDTITDGVGQGTDIVQSSVSYVLPDNVENITLTGFLNVDATGNNQSNLIIGNSGNNVLSGATQPWLNSTATGADTLAGGAGDDSYYVSGPTGSAFDHTVDDVVQEAAGGGIDTVYLWAYDYTLTANVENLVSLNRNAGWLSGGVPVVSQLTGNALDNLIDYSGSRTAGARLDGGLGADTMMGGSQDDLYIVDNAGDVVDETSAGFGSSHDRVQSSISFTLGDLVEDLTLAGSDAISGTGNGLDNVISGSTNSGANVLAGGLGNDTYLIDGSDSVVEAANAGIDTVTIAQGAVADYRLASYANVENLTIADAVGQSSASGDSADNILQGNRYANVLAGGDGNDTLYDQISSIPAAFDWDTLSGGAGNDSLVSAYGADVLDGGAGDDTITDQATGTIVFGHGYGHDVLYAYSASLGRSVRFTPDVSPADLQARRNGADLVLSLDTGDTLTVAGFYPDAISTQARGLVGSLAFADGTQIDQPTLHALANGNLHLGPSAGSDLVLGTAGADTLAGGTGDDTLAGGEGADRYVYNLGDGADVLRGSDGSATVDVLQFGVGIAASDVTVTREASGVLLALGNGGTVLIEGSEGALAAERVEFSDGTVWSESDLIPPNHEPIVQGTIPDLTAIETQAFSYTIPAGTIVDPDAGDSLVYELFTASGADLPSWINFDPGTRTISGTPGTTAAGSLGLELWADDGRGGYAFAAFTLDVLNIVNGNSSANTLTGTSGRDAIYGLGGNDTINGGAGADLLVGGVGSDTYTIDNVGDVVLELAGEGVDSVSSGITYTLAANVEKLTLTGTGALNGTGNELANTLTGNSGSNVLDGGAGADTMAGGAGNDTYCVDSTSDVVTEASSAGTDTIVSSVALATLAANVENLTLTGTGDFMITGNTLNNALTGNGGSNSITGGAGNDTLNGQAGADTLVGGTGSDTYLLARGYGADTVQENDATAGNTDSASFASDIAADQLWFLKSGNNLEVSIIGTADKFVLSNWYLGNQYHVEQFRTDDGTVLLDTQVQNLVNAMASFAPPAAGQTTLPTDYAAQLNPVIAANWH